LSTDPANKSAIDRLDPIEPLEIQRVAVLGYSMLRAGLTLQTVLKPKALRLHAHGDADADQDTETDKAKRLIYAPMWVAMCSSNLGRIDQRLQMVGRSFVDLKENRAPPLWEINFLGIDWMLEAVVRYQEIETKLGNTGAGSASVVQALDNEFKSFVRGDKRLANDDTSEDIFEQDNVDYKLARFAHIGSANVRIGTLLGYTRAETVSIVMGMLEAKNAEQQRRWNEERLRQMQMDDYAAKLANAGLGKKIELASDFHTFEERFVEQKPVAQDHLAPLGVAEAGAPVEEARDTHAVDDAEEAGGDTNYPQAEGGNLEVDGVVNGVKSEDTQMDDAAGPADASNGDYLKPEPSDFEDSDSDSYENDL
jgi:hypothetical protein